jgi:hypothetical protein
MHSTLQLYATREPRPQDTADIFKGTWSSKLPGGLESGHADTFQDARVDFVQKEFNFSGKHVLELGPMEAGHTFGMHALGAESITGVEANSNCYLKCLMVKEMYNLNRAKFLYGDIVSYLEKTDKNFDIIFGSGVLYHMAEPLKLLALMKKRSNKCYIWTGFYNKEVMEPAYGDRFKDRFSDPIDLEWEGFKCKGYPQSYEEMLDMPHYSGGSAPGSVWLTDETITDFLRYLGFTRVEVHHYDTSYGYAPRFSVLAEC